jgi:CheY-like chemotaxis protein
MDMPKRIYLVDDDEDDRFLVREALMQVNPGILVIEAMDGLHLFEIIASADHEFPSLILLDVNMPRMNGLETLAKIKSMPLLSLVPVVMYSTSANPLLIKQSHEGGVAKFITKPTSFEGIIELAGQITNQYL